MREWKTLLDNSISKKQSQRNKLLDLYLENSYPKEVVNDRIAELERDLAEMIRKQAELTSYLVPVDLPDENVEVIKSFCSEVRDGLDNATFEDKRQYIDLLDVRCTLALEDQEKVAYVKCKLGAQRLSVALTSPS